VPSFNPREIHVGDPEQIIVQALNSYQLEQIAYSEAYPGDILEYQAYINKIGVYLEIFNSTALPDSTIVSGFDLKWDGTNVYFNMPDNYFALYGYKLYIYAEFDNGDYEYEELYSPLLPNSILTSININNGQSERAKIKVEQGGKKIILLDLTENDYLNYDSDTLFVESAYAIGDAFGWITRRNDTFKNIDVPFDFRARKYRRYMVDLSPLNPLLGDGYYGIGDDFNGLGTTGEFIDYFSIGEAQNIQWYSSNVSEDFFPNGGDNNVFTEELRNCRISGRFYNNTLSSNFTGNIIHNGFNDNVINSCSNNTINSGFGNNIIRRLENNTINGPFYTNIMGAFLKNVIHGGSMFLDNIDVSLFASFENNIFQQEFTNNVINGSFRNNIIMFNILSTNFSSASHVYEAYSCTIFLRSDFSRQLSYIDGTNTVQYASITA
jgi:type VI protein secretion system component Hcp